MGKIDTNKKIKRESLLNTAFQLFVTKGINKTSISDIVDNAGVAKGTFYLYFKDKVDIRNKLISHKSSQLFQNAVLTLEKHNTDNNITFEEQLIFVIDNIINQLNTNQTLLNFISKNLSWGIFKSALISPTNDDDINFYNVYKKMILEAPYEFNAPETMLFMIVELVSSTCYSCILYKEPVCLDEFKPYLYQTIKIIIRNHIISEK